MKRALVLLLLVSACGGSSSPGPSAKAAYLAKAEAVCATANNQLATAKKAQPTGVSAVGPYVHRIVEIARTNVTQLSALSAPAQDAAAVKAKVLDPLRAQLATADAYVAKVDAALTSGNQATLLTLVTNPPTQTRADLAFMKSYGFKACVTAADTKNATR